MTVRSSSRHRFATFAWLVLAYNILVILWGMVVRATGSGAGCGAHWPLCQGVLIPHAAEIATLIEFAHRLTSGVAVVLVVILVFFAFRGFPKGSVTRRFAAASVFFTLTEGLIGAALVLFGDVGTNASMSRVFILSLHLVNTFLLLASLALTAKFAGEERRAGSFRGAGGKPTQSPSPGRYATYGAALLGTLAIAVTGTIAALADTLFAATTLRQGLRWDFSGTASPLLRLRMIHPVVAVVVGGFLLILAGHALHSPAAAAGKRLARWLLALVALQMAFGLLNILLLAPLWMQALHLLTADLVWITLVLFSAEMLRRESAPLPEPHLAPFPSKERAVPVRHIPASR